MDKRTTISFCISLIVHVSIVYAMDMPIPFLFLKKQAYMKETTVPAVYYIPKIRKQSRPLTSAPTIGLQVESPDTIKNDEQKTGTRFHHKRDIRIKKVESYSVKTRTIQSEKKRVPTVENVNLSNPEIKKIFFGYYHNIREKIKKCTVYPFRARIHNIEGDIYVSFILKRTGEVKEIIVLESSGEHLLDTAAMNSIRNAAPFEPFPENLEEKEIKLNIPISFELQ